MEIHPRVRQAVREGDGALRGAALQPTFQVQGQFILQTAKHPVDFPSLFLFPTPAVSYLPTTFLSHYPFDYSPFIRFSLLITFSPLISTVFSSFRLSSLFPAFFAKLT
ncbi:hypothetical protein BDV34DRAFT_43241 [Aspergillus parasiticus]|uniref:Uncharacterized protein n=1 Tax=Aspergillus parasiticus TaxID=5067 RepID=A0A5N6D285_ASPPA|nr:hypothetical protein BDV34DRAFT_43241 [Aspergillus parasiticus]